MLPRARHRIHVSLVLIACLLFQQVAVAAYACQMDPAPAQAEHCAEMSTAPAASPVPALCEKHCTPDASVLTDAAVPAVPALALAPAFSLVLHEPSTQIHWQAVPIARWDPPPRLRYCSLLI